MSLLRKEAIRTIAEANGISNLSPDIPASLAPDVEYRIREIAQEAIKFMRHSKRQRLTVDDINSALRLRNVEALYGFTSSDPLRFRKTVGSNELYFLDDKEVDFNEVLDAPLPRVPYETTFRAHWLAIEGVQPAIPENPSPEVIKENEKKRRRAGETDSKAPEIKPLVKHVLSKEMQLYYEKVTAALKGSEDVSKVAVLDSLANDPGLHNLLPYFAQFITDEVTNNLKNLSILTAIMMMVKSLLRNPYFHIEPYLHQLMPAILTCLVGRRLCSDPSENHWDLRDLAASHVSHICQKYGSAYRTLQPRVTKTLVHALLDLKKPLTTHYGAIRGLACLGAQVVHLLLLPNLKVYCSLLEPELNSQNLVKRLEARKCYGALLETTGKVLHDNAVAFDLHMGTRHPTHDSASQVGHNEKEVEGDGKPNKPTTMSATVAAAAAAAAAKAKRGEKGAKGDGDDGGNDDNEQDKGKNSEEEGGRGMDARDGEGELEEEEEDERKTEIDVLSDLLPVTDLEYGDLYEIFGEGLIPFMPMRTDAMLNTFI